MEKAYTRPISRRASADCSVCLDCKSTLDESNWRGSLRKWRRYVCNSCWVVRQRNYAKNSTRTLEHKREVRAKAVASWSPERIEQERVRSANTRLKKYGITLEDKAKMLQAQGNICVICLTDTPTGKGDFHVDHCHRTGLVRKLLCASCNLMLGMAKDNPETLTRAVGYLVRHNPDMHDHDGNLKY